MNAGNCKSMTTLQKPWLLVNPADVPRPMSCETIRRASGRLLHRHWASPPTLGWLMGVRLPGRHSHPPAFAAVSSMRGDNVIRRAVTGAWLGGLSTSQKDCTSEQARVNLRVRPALLSAH